MYRGFDDIEVEEIREFRTTIPDGMQNDIAVSSKLPPAGSHFCITLSFLSAFQKYCLLTDL